MRAKIILIFFLSVFIAGCTLDFSLPTNETPHLTVYKLGVPTYERQLRVNDPVERTINHWFTADPENWHYAFITREPRIYVAGKRFSVNISETEVSVKYCRGRFDCNYWVKEDRKLFLEIQAILQPA